MVIINEKLFLTLHDPVQIIMTFLKKNVLCQSRSGFYAVIFQGYNNVKLIDLKNVLTV